MVACSAVRLITGFIYNSQVRMFRSPDSLVLRWKQLKISCLLAGLQNRRSSLEQPYTIVANLCDFIMRVELQCGRF